MKVLHASSGTEGVLKNCRKPLAWRNGSHSTLIATFAAPRSASVTLGKYAFARFA